MHTFDEVNLRRDIYIGEIGLEFAEKTLRILRKKLGRLPRNHDKGVGGIPNVCQRGEWEEFGITTWNDLPDFTFGKTKKYKIKKKKGKQKKLEL